MAHGPSGERANETDREESAEHDTSRVSNKAFRAGSISANSGTDGRDQGKDDCPAQHAQETPVMAQTLPRCQAIKFCNFGRSTLVYG